MFYQLKITFLENLEILFLKSRNCVFQRDDSIMTFEGTACNGKENIFNKIMVSYYVKLNHQIDID